VSIGLDTRDLDTIAEFEGVYKQEFREVESGVAWLGSLWMSMWLPIQRKIPEAREALRISVSVLPSVESKRGDRFVTILTFSPRFFVENRLDSTKFLDELLSPTDVEALMLSQFQNNSKN